MLVVLRGFVQIRNLRLLFAFGPWVRIYPSPVYAAQGYGQRAPGVCPSNIVLSQSSPKITQ